MFAYVNQAHPFREGNGRTSKVFMAHVAEQSPYRFDFARVSPEQWNGGSAMSRPDMFAYAPEPASLVPVFAAVTVERTAPQAGPDRRSGAFSAQRLLPAARGRGDQADAAAGHTGPPAECRLPRQPRTRRQS